VEKASERTDARWFALIATYDLSIRRYLIATSPLDALHAAVSALNAVACDGTSAAASRPPRTTTSTSPATPRLPTLSFRDRRGSPQLAVTLSRTCPKYTNTQCHSRRPIVPSERRSHFA
jgi:hypothetical protein